MAVAYFFMLIERKYRRFFIFSLFASMLLSFGDALGQCQLEVDHTIAPDSNGKYVLELVASKGRSPYNYVFLKSGSNELINKGDQTSNRCNDLPVGVYKCIVFDADNCKREVTVEIK